MMHDSSTMPFGKHKGEKLANVPASYLLWLLGSGCSHAGLKKYIEDNKADLEEEAENDKLKQRGQ